MATPQDVLKIARRYIGVTESPARSNRQMFGAWYGWNGVPWCAMFVSYCFYQVKMTLPITTSKGFAYCPYGVNYFRDQGKFDKNPKVGDIVFFDWRQDGISDHVGIVEQVLSRSKVVCIEGNTSYGDNSNGGQVMRRTRNIYSIQGFAHPDYDGVTSSKGDDPNADNIPSWGGQYILLTSPMLRGNDIREWQEQMIENGYRIAVDGIFGRESERALIQFQKDRGLGVDGVIGPITWEETWKES